MVKSILRPTNINYDSKTVDFEEDVGLESSRYEYEINPSLIFVISLGKEKYTYSKYDVVYFPIYLMKDERPISCIGVFEIESSNLINSLDEDGDVMLENGNIILFEFATNEFLMKKSHEERVSTSDESQEQQQKDEVIDLTEEVIEVPDEIDVMRLHLPKQNLKKPETESDKLTKGVFIIDKNKKQPLQLEQENESISDALKSEYLESSKTKWIEKFMRNNNYDIIDNEGGGDCFFAVIRDAFEQIGHVTTVEKLRTILSESVKDDVFIQYRTLYINYLSELQDKEKEMKLIKKTIAELKKRNDSVKDKAESSRILTEVKEINKRFQKVKIQKEDTEELMKEFLFMKDIDTFEKFKDYIKAPCFVEGIPVSCYWADTWAVSTIEKLLNIKIIIMSREAFEQEDRDSVLQCGQLNDSDLELQGNFKPAYYILACYLGNHYQLVTYKSKRIFKFSEIPYDIKVMVINKCLERNAGPYYLIQDFRNLKTSLGLSADEGASIDEDEEVLIDDLYDKDIVFSFYGKSSAGPKAGKGSGEKIPDLNTIDFNTLNKDPVCKNWRRKLDDSWMTAFEVDGHRWSSVEHYYLGSQFKKGYPDFYLQFSLDSGTDISTDLTVAYAAGSKSGKLKDRIVRPKNVKFDADFKEDGVFMRSQEERQLAIDAKFTQNLDLKKVLAETKKAKLVHFVRSGPAEPDLLLMKTRAKILSPSA